VSNNGSQMNSRLRLLVVIASFGEKNLELLRRIISRYRSMAFDVDVVVVSEAPKNLGPGVEVVVGLPTKDPWSLPFAHQAVMVQKAGDYDVFAYSEDDMEVTEENIRAFLRVTPSLAPDEIAGFLRYEIDESGARSLPDVHQCFRWKPESVRRRGSVIVAEFSNEHAGYYLLTRDQLRRAIASKGFVGAPNRRGRYGTPETAATDPYTSCGLRKVICVSELEDFLIHHASNRYLGLLGLPLAAFQEQVQALIEIADGTRPPKTLCPVEPNVASSWSKSLYERPCQECLDAIPSGVKTVLSIGCGWGAFEVELRRRGAKVTVLPLDSVIGATAERRGLDVIYGTLEEGLQKVQSQKFDCIVLSHLLHLLPNPAGIIEACCHVLRPGGQILLSGPNFNRLPVLAKRAFLNGDYRKMRSFQASGVNLCGPSRIAKALRNAGLRVAAVRWFNHSPLLGGGHGPTMNLGFMTAKEWLVASELA
jgi:2-polyprenyl-3-methyl-5-hydroxy-6-metoxy-1,4-benzoquinol methylase